MQRNTDDETGLLTVIQTVGWFIDMPVNFNNWIQFYCNIELCGYAITAVNIVELFWDEKVCSFSEVIIAFSNLFIMC